MDGVSTMKMMSSTSTTSINGVTLMSDFATPFLPPTSIAMTETSYSEELAGNLLGSGAAILRAPEHDR
jgi:hypothetical protein